MITSPTDTRESSKAAQVRSLRDGSKPPTAKLVLDGLNKYYGPDHVVRDLSLDVQPSEVITLLGPSGSGKTTTMMMVAGFVTPDSGSVQLDGRRINDIPPYKRDIGVVFQSYALFPHMSVIRNVEFPLRQRGVGRAEARKKAGEMLDLVGLNHLASRKAPQLSGGQQQRVALARALVFDPPLLIMDEPLSALDKRLREQMQEEIKRIQETMGVTALFVTHDQTEAFVLSDRVVVMNEGQILQVGSPDELYENPSSDFVAEFVGESNLLQGEMSFDQSGYTFVTERGARFAVETGLKDANRLLIRPERIRIVASPVGSGETLLEGRVMSSSYFGNAYTYRVQCEGESLLVRAPANELPIFKRGEKVHLVIEPASCVPLSS